MGIFLKYNGIVSKIFSNDISSTMTPRSWHNCFCFRGFAKDEEFTWRTHSCLGVRKAMDLSMYFTCWCQECDHYWIWQDYVRPSSRVHHDSTRSSTSLLGQETAFVWCNCHIFFTRTFRTRKIRGRIESMGWPAGSRKGMVHL